MNSGPSSLRYLTTSQRTVPESFIRLESRDRFPGLMTDEEASDGGGHDSIFIPGGGICRRVFEACQTRPVAVTLLLKFCSEGDNSMDGVQLAEYANQLTGLQAAGCKLRLPASWIHLFGAPPPTQMFW